MQDSVCDAVLCYVQGSHGATRRVLYGGEEKGFMWQGRGVQPYGLRGRGFRRFAGRPGVTEVATRHGRRESVLTISRAPMTGPCSGRKHVQHYSSEWRKDGDPERGVGSG